MDYSGPGPAGCDPSPVRASLPQPTTAAGGGRVLGPSKY